MKLNRLLGLCSVVFPLTLWGQGAPKQDDLTFPIQPKRGNYLSGTMGELRGAHFHTGIDIKTGGQTGLPVHATQAGYIQRIRVSGTGYGHALYMTHPPSGLISVYAHLKAFDPVIAQYVRKKQYEQKSFEVDLRPEKNRFRYEKGAIIAWSGNSGSSQGPHLHFELRTADHQALDPLSFGFSEVADSIPPTVVQVAFVTMDDSSRVNGMYGRVELDVLSGKDKKPYISKGVSLYGNIGVEIYAYDRLNRASNKNGIRCETLSYDGHPVFQQDIRQINFALQRNILVHTNHKRWAEGGTRFDKLYVEKGNPLSFYTTDSLQGVLRISDTLRHEVTLVLEDTYGNTQHLLIPINEGAFENSRALKHTYALDHDDYDIQGDYLEFEAQKACYRTKVFLGGVPHLLEAEYQTQAAHHFLWDLRQGLPDSAQTCERTINFHLKQRIAPGQKARWQSDDLSILFPKGALFDALYLRYEKKIDEDGKEWFVFKNEGTPLKQYVSLSLRPQGVYDTKKTAVYTVSHKGKLSYVGGQWIDSTWVFKTRSLTTYTLATDTVPPRITQLKSPKSQARFRVKDDRSGIRSCQATLNGQWLLMNFDPKRGYLWSDEHTPIKGDFSLVVEDFAGNASTYESP